MVIKCQRNKVKKEQKNYKEEREGGGGGGEHLQGAGTKVQPPLRPLICPQGQVVSGHPLRGQSLAAHPVASFERTNQFVYKLLCAWSV